jgi:cation/acetate symporter
VFAPLHASAFAFGMPGSGLEAFSGPYLQSFGHVGRLALPLAIMVIASGLAGLPSVLNRAGTTTTVYEARKSAGWAVFIVAFMLLTLASIAAFMHGYVAEQVVGAPGDRMPIWFQTLAQLGFADVSKTQASVGLASVQFRRDVAFVALPMAAGLPRVLVTLAAMGALAAAWAGASAQIVALGGMLSEDLLHGQRREPPSDSERLRSARVSIAVAGALGLVVATVTSDPLATALAALALSSATGFPVLVLSILWRKVSRLGAAAGMSAGFGVTALLMFGSATGAISMSPLVAAAIGGPINMAVMAFLSQASSSTTRRALEVVRDIRLPGGEATYDREQRLNRRKRSG